MVEPMREVGFGIPVMPQGAFHVFADASKWTDDSYYAEFRTMPSRRLMGSERALICSA